MKKEERKLLKKNQKLYPNLYPKKKKKFKKIFISCIAVIIIICIGIYHLHQKKIIALNNEKIEINYKKAVSSINKTFKSENATYKILSIKNSKIINKESDYLKEKANNTFLIVELEIKNTSDTPIHFSKHDYTLEYNKKEIGCFDIAAKDNAEGKEPIPFLDSIESLNPENNCVIYILFDTTKKIIDSNDKELIILEKTNTTYKIPL